MAKAKTSTGKNNALQVYPRKDESIEKATARAIIEPFFRHGVTLAQVHKTQFGDMAGDAPGAPGFGDYSDAIRLMGEQAAQGDLSFVSRMLAAQAVTLDSMFTEMTRRMALNMGEHPQATDLYARQAMKAQAQSRATLEALAKIYQPREQTVRHVHINQGGQAVIADEFHNHTGGTNAQENEQSHAPKPDIAAGASPALPCPNPIGDTVPMPCGVGAAAVPYARGEKPRRPPR